jgi:cysteinyl-tRNA synthetase
MNKRIGERDLGDASSPSAQVLAALSDDLNTPQVITELRAMSTRIYNYERGAASGLMESCEFLGLLRPDWLGVYNTYYVGTGPKMIKPEYRRLLHKIQVAEANGNPTTTRGLIAQLAKAGVRVRVHESGSVDYEVLGDGIDVKALIDARLAARATKNWVESDRIRDELDAMGIVLKDNKDGTTTWEPKR